MSTKMISLTSSDGQTFEIEEEVASQSQTIDNMIKDDCTAKGIPLPNVTSKILEIVIEYWKKHHVDAANPLTDEDLKKWDEKFMDNYQSTIFDLIMAANYLNIKSLLDLACQTVVDMVKDNTLDQIREFFNIENDFTPEEEKAVLEDNKWAFE